VGARDTSVILGRAPQGALRLVRGSVLYAQGLVVGGTSLGLERE
jgi:hypothetical protein